MSICHEIQMYPETHMAALHSFRKLKGGGVHGEVQGINDIIPPPPPPHTHTHSYTPFPIAPWGLEQLARKAYAPLGVIDALRKHLLDPEMSRN